MMAQKSKYLVTHHREIAATAPTIQSVVYVRFDDTLNTLSSFIFLFLDTQHTHTHIRILQ